MSKDKDDDRDRNDDRYTDKGRDLKDSGWWKGIGNDGKD